MTHRFRSLIFGLGALGCALLFVVGVLGIPSFGGDVHPYGDRSVAAALARGTANAVSSVNFDQRALDTIGEELILFAAALGAVVLLRVVAAEEEEPAAEHAHGSSEVIDSVRLTGQLMLPVTLVAGVYIVAHGHASPGGGFQGGVVLGTAIHLIYLAGDYPALARLRPLPVFDVAEAVAAGAFVVLGLAFAGLIPPMNAGVGVEVGAALVLLLAKFFEQALLVRPERRTA